MVEGKLIAYGACTFFMMLLHNVFLLYHIKAYIHVFKIDQSAFWVGEILFLIWNSLNDFIFGWFADKWLLQHDGSRKERVPLSSLLRRIAMLRRGGLGMAASFVLIWIPVIGPAWQFPVVLCLYDSFLTTVDLAHNALLADLADNGLYYDSFLFISNKASSLPPIFVILIRKFSSQSISGPK